MDVVMRGAVGPRTTKEAGDGTELDFAMGPQGETLSMDGHGKYYELARRGQVFSVSTAVAGTTIVAANNSPIAANAASILSLYNPIDSGYNLELIRTWLFFISGTPGAGMFVYNYAFLQNVTAAENAPAVPHKVSGVQSVGLGFTQTALTGAAAQLRGRGICTLFAGAIAASSPVNYRDDIDGEIVVPPGGLLSIASPATGTTCVVAATMAFAQVPR